MKRLHELEPGELLALTMEQVDELIGVECAHRGVPLATQCPTPPAPCEVQPDATCYKVDITARFATREQAEDFTTYLQTLAAAGHRKPDGQLVARTVPSGPARQGVHGGTGASLDARFTTPSTP